MIQFDNHSQALDAMMLMGARVRGGRLVFRCPMDSLRRVFYAMLLLGRTPTPLQFAGHAVELEAGHVTYRTACHPAIDVLAGRWYDHGQCRLPLDIQLSRSMLVSWLVGCCDDALMLPVPGAELSRLRTLASTVRELGLACIAVPCGLEVYSFDHVRSYVESCGVPAEVLGEVC